MKLQPLGDRVVIKPLSAQEKKRGGIVIPDTAKEKPQAGEVVAVGKGKPLENGQVKAPEVKVGNRVLYGKYSGTEFQSAQGDEWLIMREDEILAITT